MAEAKGNTAVPQGDRDRVAMLSLKADGTPDQTNPQMIGERDFALAATKEQFRQQAVSAVDQAERAEAPAAAGEVTQDPAIEALKAAHDAAASSAEKAAESTVNALFTDDTAASTAGKSTTAAKASATR